MAEDMVIKTHLYDIARSYKGLEELVESGEISPEDAADTFEAIEGDFTQKVTQILKIMRNFDAFADSAEEEAARLKSAAASARGKVAWLKSYIHSQMNRVGMKSVKTILGTVSITPPTDSAVIDDVLLLPDEFVEYNPELAYVPKKSDIRLALRAGREIPGAHLAIGGETLKYTPPRTSKAKKEDGDEPA